MITTSTNSSLYLAVIQINNAEKTLKFNANSDIDAENEANNIASKCGGCVIDVLKI